MFKVTFNKNYFLLFVLLLVAEVLIALYVHDNFIRPFFGDFLVVILIYTFVLSFIKASKTKLAIGVLIFSFLIEFAQYFDLIYVLGLHENKLAKTVLGHAFAIEDLVMYTLGIAFVLIAEYFWNMRK